MAAKKSKNIPLRTLITFFILVIALAGTLAGATIASNASWLPKLAIDLEGGTQLILTPKKTDGSSGAISDQDIEQAIEVIRQRVDASGVAEAEILRSGNENISVGLPGTPSEETLNLIRSSAVMRFRPVIASAPGMVIIPDPAKQNPAEQNPAEQNDPAKQPAPTATPEPAKPVAQVLQEAEKLSNDVTVKDEKNFQDEGWISPQQKYLFENVDCTQEAARTGGSNDDPKKGIFACSKDGREKYLLGPMVLSGQDIKSAASGQRRTQQGNVTNEWEVALSLNSEGAKKFDDVAKVLYAARGTQGEGHYPDKNRFAIVLDSLVVSAPGVSTSQFNGSASISGSLNRQTSATLGNQIQFGSLPLNFEVQQEQKISATLGAEHLRIGFWAAIIGLVLVILYLLWHYHALSAVAVSSLALAALLTYLVITILSWSMGYRLSLAGVVGLIVAVGTTVDSFIVYFERIRDEVRDGRSLYTAVEGGWARAKRTIVVSDMVNIVAAGVLYFLAVGGVQGFAFTLGLTTFIDLVIIFMFTHPTMALLIRTRYFGEGRGFSGLDPVNLGAASERAYVQRGPAKTKRGQKTVAAPTVSLARAKQERQLAQQNEESAQNLSEEAQTEAVVPGQDQENEAQEAAK